MNSHYILSVRGWCDVHEGDVIGFCFFEDGVSNVVTMIGERNRNTINLLPIIDELGLENGGHKR